jgi:hypothetical protein
MSEMIIFGVFDDNILWINDFKIATPNPSVDPPGLVKKQ